MVTLRSTTTRISGSVPSFTLSAVRPKPSRIVLFLSVTFIISILLMCLQSLPENKGHLYAAEKDRFTESVNEILQDTPYLWRPQRLKTNDTVKSRVNSQRDWIKKFSKTDFLRFTKTKNILVQDDLNLLYCTQGKMKCPYAPEFENKCNLIQQTYKDVFTNSLKYGNIDAVVSKRTWEFQLYEYLIPSYILQILYILEPPFITKKVDLKRNNALVASYWRGSDIPTPYRMWVPKDSKDSFEPMTCTGGLDHSQIERRSKPTKHYQKSKMVAALVSNCDDTNGRLDFIAELQKYVQVDVYGKCGNLSCPKSVENVVCMTKLEEEYKFFLAIENSNCVDYITEKFFTNGFKYDMVPIVMGAHPDNYKDAAPSSSFIHVEDFESPRSLADYLLKLDRDEDAYAEYLESKRTGYITSSGLGDFFCRLCGMLYYADYVKPPTWESPIVLWDNVNKCLPPKQWYWTQQDSSRKTRD